MKINLRSCAAFAAIPLLFLAGAGRASAAITVVTPGEQNTQSGENGCSAATAAQCAAGHWYHYPELLQAALGNGYSVKNNGDGGAVLGCDPTTASVANGGSFCTSTQYTSSLTPQPDIVIIGPFGEHDQRIVGANNGNVASLYMQSVFEAAYEGLVQKYLKTGTKIYMMTPIDLPWGGTPNLPGNDDLVKDIMLPAALKVAMNHSLTVIDAYTAISSTPALVTMYLNGDGQVKASGQQKMADLILAALMGGGAGGTNGAGGAGGATGAGGAAGTAGAAGTSGGTAGTTGAGGTGAGGSTSTTTGTAGTSGGTAGTTGAAGSGAGGSTSTTAGTAGSTGGAAGTSGTSPGAAGTAGSSSGAAGTAGATPVRDSSGSSGCAIASTNKGGPLGLAVAAMLAALVIGRRRARRR
jgi:hypothetical protein